jgi:hypothetical protein
MGDCRICIQISKQCLGDRIEEKKNVDLVTVSKKLWSADSTIYELFGTTTVELDSIPSTLLSLIQSGSVSVWDCTSYPPQNITDLCKDIGLCQIKTLFSVGWFPSGNLQFLPSNADEPVFASPDLYDDIQYNGNPLRKETECDDLMKPSSKVYLMGGEGVSLAPSQVLHGVANRFNTDEMGDNKNFHEALRIRQEIYQKRREVEALRNRKLDDRIRKLSDNGKGKPVSDQVRKMLIKSRATGRTSVRPEDRVYLHFIFWNDADDVDASNDETFRFFSIQDTVGYAVSSLGVSSDSQRMEMLVKTTNCDESNEYRQLPYALRLYDAIDQKFLSREVNTVIVRCLASDDQYCTPHIVATVNDQLESLDMVTNESACGDSSIEVCNNLRDQVQVVAGTTNRRLVDALELPLRTIGQVGVKKSSAAKEKVRQMQMKSKAKGDAKRVKAVEQRFFLHCITVVGTIVDGEDYADSSIRIFESAPIFVSRLDPLHRLLRERAPEQRTVNKDKSLPWEILVVEVSGDSMDGISLKNILTSEDMKDEKKGNITWGGAEESGRVKCFDTVVLRYIVKD